MLTTQILPIMLAVTLAALVSLTLIKGSQIKLIRRVVIATISMMLIPLLFIFAERVVNNESTSLKWTSYQWTTDLLANYGTVKVPFAVHFNVDIFTAWLLIIATVVTLTIAILGHYIKTRHKAFYLLTLFLYFNAILIILSNQAWLSLVGLMFCSYIVFIMSGIWSRAESYKYATRFMFIQSIGFVLIGFSLFLIQYVVLNYEEQPLLLKQLTSYIDAYAYINISQVGYRNIALISLIAGIAFLLPLVGFHRSFLELFRHAHYPVLIAASALYLPLIAYVSKQYLYVFFIDYMASIKPYITIVCVLQIGYMAINLWKTKQIKSWIGYLILANIPIVYILLVSEALVTVSFSLVAIISYMLITALLLTVMAALQERQKQHSLEELKGLITSQPYLTSTIVLTFLAVCGLPVFSHFFTIFHTFYAVYDLGVYIFIICLVSMFLVVINVFLHMSKLFIRGNERTQGHATDLRFTEILPIIMLISLIVVLGIYPNVFLEQIEPYVEHMLSWKDSFSDTTIWGTNVYGSLLIGDKIITTFQYGLAALSLITLLITMWLASNEKQKMLHWVLWTASHFASVGLVVLVVSIDLTEPLLWKQLMFYCLSIVLIYLGTHFLLSRHMYRSQYEDAIHYQGLYYKSKSMHKHMSLLIVAIIGFPVSAIGIVRHEMLSQLFIARYILLAFIVMLSFVFIMRPLWYWLAQITFPAINESLLNKNEQIEDWNWTKLEKLLVLGSITINPLLMIIYILL